MKMKAAMSWRPLVAAAMAMLLATGTLTAAAKDEIRVGGTGNALGTMTLLGEAYMKASPEANVRVLASIGSSGAIKAVPKGAIEIGLSSRPLKEGEASSGIVAVEYARSPTVFAVAAKLPVKNVTRRQVAEIYAGKMTAWPDGTRIRPILRQPGDDNTIQIKTLSPEIERAIDLADERKGMPDATTDQEAADKAEQIAGGFGITALSLILSENRRLRALALDGVEPTAENLASGKYPLAKHFYLVLPADPAPPVKKFVAFLRSPAAMEILKRNGHHLP